MAITTTSKVAIGTVLLGTLGYFGKDYFLGTKVSDLIKQHNPEKKLIPSTTSIYSEKWKNAWKRYLEDNKDKNPWEIPVSDLQLASSTKIESVPTSFIDACEAFSESSIVGPSTTLYKQVLDWCTSSSFEKISELIKEKGKRIIKLQEKDGAEVKAALTKYLSEDSNSLGIESFEKGLQETNEAKWKLALESFVKKCEELSKQSEGVTDDDISKTVSYCSVDRTLKDLIEEERKNKTFIDLDKIKPETLIAVEIWNRYFEKNKDKEKDEWDVGEWGKKKEEKIEKAPEGFFNKCKDKWSKVALNFETREVDDLIRYCTYDSKLNNVYADKLSAKAAR